MKKQLLLVILLFAGLSVLNAQDVSLGKGFSKDKKGQDAFYRAEEFFDGGNYLLALPLYRSLEPQYGESQYLLFRIGICLLYKSDELDNSLTYLLGVKEKNSKAADIDLYLARAYHLNERYDEALASLDTYEKRKNNAPEKLEEAKRLRQYCLNAKIVSASPVDYRLSNLSETVNTENSEYVPVVTSDDSVMLFTYRGQRSIGSLQAYPGVPDSGGFYFEDVFISYRDGNGWGEPVALDSTINTNGHDACIGLSNDGQSLLIYKDDEGNGDIYLSQLYGDKWSKPMPLYGNVNSPSWEGSATFSSDMQTMYFASERPGGYGGRDIWVATLQQDGSWGNVKNLGPKINTPYNEDAPFLHPNSVTLLFSSEGHNSMGGYDIFRTDLTPVDSTFSEPSDPRNIGYPINTPGDDKYFILGTDGRHGYYSSGKSGGQGQQDIYLVTGDFDLKDANVLLVSGIITLDGRPVKASVNVRDEEGKLRAFRVQSNPVTGKYLVNLPQGKKYSITYELEGGDDRQVRQLDASTTTMQMRREEINVPFLSDEYRARQILARRDSLKQIDTAMFKTFPLDSLTMKLLNPYDYGMVVKFYGDAKADGLIFRVQVAAYNFPDNYVSAHLRTLGTIDRVVLDDRITRFTMGQFATLAEAEAYRQKIIAAGQTDAFVTAERNGKRYLIRDLVLEHFFQGKEYFENRPWKTL